MQTELFTQNRFLCCNKAFCQKSFPRSRWLLSMAHFMAVEDAISPIPCPPRPSANANVPTGSILSLIPILSSLYGRLPDSSRQNNPTFVSLQYDSTTATLCILWSLFTVGIPQGNASPCGMLLLYLPVYFKRKLSLLSPSVTTQPAENSFSMPVSSFEPLTNVPF